MNKSNCIDENDLLALLSGGIDEESALKFESHLQECSGCRQALQTLELETDDLLQNLNGEVDSSFESIVNDPAFVKVVQRMKQWPEALASPSTTDRADPGRDLQATPPRSSAISSSWPQDGEVGTPSGPSKRFRILRPHAQGGLGNISVAMDQELNREVALKEIQPQFAKEEACRARFVQEAEVTGGLEHPGIVPVYGLGQRADGMPFYAMRLIRGHSLKEAINRFHQSCSYEPRSWALPSLELRRLLGRFIDVCNAVEYAHSRGVLHRDLKPDNVMLGDYGETLLVDWGLAKSVNPSLPCDESHGLGMRSISAKGGAPTRMGAVVGTPAYMSPEQAAGRLDRLGPPSDVYSLGATLYCILTGRAPFVDENVTTLINKVRRGEFSDPSELRPAVPKPLVAICLKAMSTDISDRYPRPGALAADLERYLADESVSIHREPTTVRVRRWMRKHPGTVATATTTVLAGLISAIVIAAIVSDRNRDLTAANMAELTAKHEAEAQRDRAEKNLRRAQQTVDEFFTEVSDEQLLNEPGMQRLRHSLLNRALSHYKEFVREFADDDKTQFSLATAFIRVGNILEQVGSSDEALDNYTHGLALLEEFATQNSDNSQVQADLAEAYTAIGLLNSGLGQTDLAQNQLGQSLQIRMKLLAEQPADLHAQRKLARTHRLLAELQHSIGEADASAHFKEAVTILRPLCKNHPDVAQNPALHTELAKSYEAIAVRQSDSDAVDSYRQAIDIQRQIVANHPRVFTQQVLLGNLLQSLAVRLRESDRVESAKSFEEALAVRERLAIANPDVLGYQSDLGWTCDQLAFVFHQAGRLEEALQLFERARAIHETLVEEDPQYIDYQIRLATILNGVALVQRDLDQFDQSLAAFRDAVAVQEILVERHPNIISYRQDLAGTHKNTGRLNRRWKRWDEALDSYNEALAINQELAREYPDRPQLRRWTGETWMGIAVAHELRGAIGDAIEAKESALNIFSNLVRDEPDNSVFAYRRMTSQIGLALLHVRNGEYELATGETEAMLLEYSTPGPLDYDAACVFSLASATAAGDKSHNQQDRNRLAEQFASRAVDLLRSVVRAGEVDLTALLAEMKDNTDLVSLRTRADFQQLFSDVEAQISENAEPVPPNNP